MKIAICAEWEIENESDTYLGEGEAEGGEERGEAVGDGERVPLDHFESSE